MTSVFENVISYLWQTDTITSLCFKSTLLLLVNTVKDPRVSGRKQKKAGSAVFQAELRRQAGDVVKQKTGLDWGKVGQVVMGSASGRKGEGERVLCGGEAKLLAELFFNVVLMSEVTGND